MAREYAKIATSIWRSRKFQSLGSQAVHAKLLYFYLHTCPSTNSIGCFQLPIGYIQIDTGLSEVQIRKAIDTLSIGYLIDWNEAEQIFRVVDFIVHDPPTNPKHAMSLLSVTNMLPDCEQKIKVYEDLSRVCQSKNLTAIADQADSLSIAYRKGIQTSRPLPLPLPLPKEKESISAEPPVAAAPVASPEPFIVIPTNQKDTEFPIYEPEIVEFEKLYPGVDVRQELRSMRAWSVANDRRRKTSSGMMRFVNSWLSKAQNSVGVKVNGHDAKKYRPDIFPETRAPDQAAEYFAKQRAEEEAKQRAEPSDLDF